jgi:hypothetical protein
MAKFLANCLCISLLCLSPQIRAAVEHKVVQSEGRGDTVGEAITQALIEAVGRVNGKSIENESMLKTSQLYDLRNDEESLAQSEELKERVKTRTKGVVEEYDILKQSDEDGQKVVTLSVKVLKFVRSQNSNRKRVAVFPFKVSGKPFQVGEEASNPDNIVRKLNQGIATQLVQSRRFTVLDRNYIAEISSEKEMILSGEVATEEMVKLGEDLVADFVLVGTIEDLRVNVRRSLSRLTQRELLKFDGFVNVSYRILEIATRQIKYADVVKLNLGDAELKALAPTLAGDELEFGLIDRASAQVGRKVLDAIYPVLVVMARGDVLTLGQGGEGVRKGDQVEVYQYGERIRDPYTKESLGREEILVAVAEITRVNAKTSLARLVEADIDLEKEFAERKFVCRVIEPDNPLVDPQEKELREEIGNKKKQRDSFFD